MRYETSLVELGGRQCIFLYYRNKTENRNEGKKQVTEKLQEGWGKSQRGGTSGQVGRLPIPWKRVSGKERPLPVLDAQDGGLPVLKGRLKEMLDTERVPAQMEGAPMPRRRPNFLFPSAPEILVLPCLQTSLPPARCGTSKYRESAYHHHRHPIAKLKFIARERMPALTRLSHSFSRDFQTLVSRDSNSGRAGATKRLPRSATPLRLRILAPPPSRPPLR